MATQTIIRDRGRYLEGPLVVDRPLQPGEYPAVVVNDNYDQERQYRRGPTVTLSDGIGTVTYDVIDKALWQLKQEKIQRLAEIRWQRETGGITVAGMAVPTDRDTQGRVVDIVNAYADGDLIGPVDFKLPDGFVSLGADELRAIKAAGAQHIQLCFSRERALSEEIEAAGEAAALDAIDITAGWP